MADNLTERATRTPTDIVASLTYELPALVLFSILGIPSDNITDVKAGSADRL